MFGAELLAPVGFESCAKNTTGHGGVRLRCGSGVCASVPQFDSLPSLSDCDRTALLPCERDEAVMMADSIRHGYLLKGVEMKYDDTELMVGYDTLESETYDL